MVDVTLIRPLNKGHKVIHFGTNRFRDISANSQLQLRASTVSEASGGLFKNCSAISVWRNSACIAWLGIGKNLASYACLTVHMLHLAISH